MPAQAEVEVGSTKFRAAAEQGDVSMNIFLRQCTENHVHLDILETGSSAVFKDMEEFSSFITICQDFASRLKAQIELPAVFLHGWDDSEGDSDADPCN